MKPVVKFEILFLLIPIVVSGQIPDGCVRNPAENGRISQSISMEAVDVDELRNRSYRIPTVIHVFHDGDAGRLTTDQVLSGIEVVNRDFHGLNSDWDQVPQEFDSIKSTLSLELCLATIDEQGNETSGIIYYNDADAAYNRKDLTVYAWDNYRYLNIYLPIYVYEEPDVRTAFTNLPSDFFSRNGNDGIFYSSIRWGYGDHSELEEGSELASIATHEVGHWLNLRHTFLGDCESPNDFVSDTPPVEDKEINFLDCSEVPFMSCGVNANISNYMDYNHGCKKMFTRGQVDRMLLALQLPVRNSIWNVENLYSTGCLEPSQESIRISYSAEIGYTFFLEELPATFRIFNLLGDVIYEDEITDNIYRYNPASSFREVQIFTFSTNQGLIKRKLYVE